MKKFLLVTAILAGIMVLGCSKKDGGAAADEGSAKKVTIVVGGWPSADVGFKGALPGFYEKYPNIEVELEMMENTDHHQALATSLAAGQGTPDVVMINGNYMSQYTNSSAFINLLDPPYNAEQYRDDFVGYKWNHGYSSDKKRLIGFSWDIGPASYFYRADIFESVGLPSDPDEVAKYMNTWKGVLDVAQKVHIPGQRWLINESTSFLMELYALDDFYNEDLTLRLDRPGILECIDMVTAMRKGNLDMNSNMWSTEGKSAIDNGSVVSVVSGSWFGGFLKADFDPDGAGNWRVTTLPGNVPSSNFGGSFMSIPNQSKYKDEAWAFLSYMLATKKGQNDIFLAVDYFPTYKPAWDDPAYDESDPYFGGQKTRALWKKIAQGLPDYVFTTIMDVTAVNAVPASVLTGIDQGLNTQQIMQLVRTDIDNATSELRRQQIQIFRDAGVWKD
jgi:multiple sugar transport system substrate-binding protein